MAEPLSGFDEFLREFRAASGDPLLDYWADVIFVMRWNPNRLVEKRFMGGIPLWLTWALKTLLLEKQTPVTINRETHPIDGFRLLPTPAHHDSLAPLIEEANPGTLRIYGDPNCAIRGHRVETGFPASLAALNRRERLVALLKTFRIWRKIHRILLKIDEPGHAPNKDFAVRLIEQILTSQMELMRLRKTEPPLRTLFLTYELAADSKAMVMWARENGSRIVHVMHGQRLPTYQLTLATDLILLSKLDETWFRERIPPDVRIWSEGHPRLEMMRRRVQPATAPAPGRLPRIAFFSQPSEGDYSREQRIADWRLLASLADRAEVRFRQHPRESKEAALEDLRYIGADFITWSDAGLEEDLEWCDAIASSWSTVSMEAAACGRGVFWTCASPERYGVPNALRKHDIGALIAEPSHWEPYLKDWMVGSWSAPVVVPEAHLRELGMIGDMEQAWMSRLGIPITSSI